MTAAAINTHQLDELAAYYNENLGQAPWREKLLSKIDTNQNIDVDLGTAKIPLPLRILRPLTVSLIMDIAARRWLRPTLQHPTQTDLTRLRAAVGLGDLSARAFAEKLRDKCVELQHAHGPIGRWIQRQTALIDLSISPPPEMGSDSVRAAIALRQGLFQAMSILPVSPTTAAGLAQQISRDALRAAAFATCSVFGGECHVSANLMIPVRGNTPLPNYPAGSLAAAARARGDALWEGLSAPRRLLVVGETRGAGHVGFWVPILRANNGDELPGGPYAFLRMSGQAVFKDDLPGLAGFPESTREKWRDYMHRHFNERLFASIPLLVPDSAMPGTGSIAIAVLNVNASPQHEETWYRAYHEEWLRIAQGRVAAFAEIAVYACLTELEADRTGGKAISIHIDTGSIIWDRLPIGDPKLLAGEGQ
jgi:hypothetical protein